MTNERAKEVLQEQIDRYGQEYDAEGIEALEIAIKVLEQTSYKSDARRWKRRYLDLKQRVIKLEEQQLCEDIIRRADVLALAEKGVLVSNDNYQAVCKSINELPSVIPKGETITEFADRCRECGAKYGELLKSKTGSWMVHPKGGCAHLVCSKCLSDAPFDCKTNFCPNCGSRMIEPQESESDD